MVETSILIPLRNEEMHIETCLNSILRTSYSLDKLEIIIIDGLSTDNTIEKIKKFNWRTTKYSILSNSNKTVPFALNMGIKKAAGKFIIRMDCHTIYDKNYIPNCVRLLKAGKGHNVGGPMRVRRDNPIFEAIAIATSSKFGIGNSNFHFEDFEGEVESVYLGAFNREVFDRVGLFDESLTRNQDDEFNLRIIKNGLKIFQSPDIKSLYTPRASLIKLFSQYYQYGFWKPRVIKKHKGISSYRHLVPSLFCIIVYLNMILFIFKLSLFTLYLPIILYLIGNVYFSLNSKRIFKSTVLLLPLVYSTLHLSYGHGFLLGLYYNFLKTND